MDENVSKAVDRLTANIYDTDCIAYRDAQTIRARLVELEAENERLRKIEAERWSVVATRNAAVMRAERAEALLREADPYVFGNNRDLAARIINHFTTHLSEPRT